MRIILLFVFSLISFTAGIREEGTTVKALLVNNTVHPIKVLPYANGIVHPDDSIYITPSDTFKFGYTNLRGIVDQGGFLSEYFNSDSMQVIFSDSHKVVHYFRELPDSLSKKALLQTSTRNLYNYSSYEYYAKDNSKFSRASTYT